MLALPIADGFGLSQSAGSQTRSFRAGRPNACSARAVGIATPENPPEPQTRRICVRRCPIIRERRHGQECPHPPAWRHEKSVYQVRMLATARTIRSLEVDPRSMLRGPREALFASRSLQPSLLFQFRRDHHLRRTQRYPFRAAKRMAHSNAVCLLPSGKAWLLATAACNKTAVFVANSGYFSKSPKPALGAANAEPASVSLGDCSDGC